GLTAASSIRQFLDAQIGNYVASGPAADPVWRPAIVIARSAADIVHRIDGGLPTDNSSARTFQSAPPGRGFGLGEIHPVMLAIEQQARPSEWNLDPWVAIPAAGFDQKDAPAGVLA